MKINVRAQEPLRKLLDNEQVVEVSGTTILEVIKILQSRYPSFAQRLLDETGSVRRFVNIYVNEEDIRFLQNQQTTLQDGDEVRIIPSIAGG
ncbi:MAG: MoaD family protein [Verrucomicrobiota bacterium]